MALALWEPTLHSEAQRWHDVAANLTREYFAPAAEQLDREGTYPWGHVKQLVQSGLAALFVPTEFGGQGADLTTISTVVDTVSRGCASTGAILSAYILGAFPLILAGTPEQHREFLPQLVDGNAMSFALTEEGAGSDVSNLATTATREGGNWRIRGEKIYIGNGGASRFYVVFARVNDESVTGVTAFIVDKEQDGVVIDRYEDKMGIRGTNTSNLKLDTVVDDSRIVGQPGKGIRLALSTLNIGRVSVAAQSAGLAYAALQAATAEATRRHTFGTAIIDHQGIGFQLADAATRLTAAQMLTYEAARIYDAGGDISTLGAMAKLYASEAAHYAANAAVQVYGGEGYCKPCIAERLYRDQRVLEIYEGSSEIQRLVIARALKKSA
jgi:alkylation response protein AidB-like acyl-CoA dehydrogenase